MIDFARRNSVFCFLLITVFLQVACSHALSPSSRNRIPRTIRWGGQVFLADTVRSSFHPLAGKEEVLHVYFKNMSHTVIDTPQSLIRPSAGYENEWIILARDTLEDGSELLKMTEPDLHHYSGTSLLLNSTYEEIAVRLSPCFSRKTAKRFSELHVQIFIELLVDDSGTVIETSQHIFAEKPLTDRQALRAFARLDSAVKTVVRFDDDGRFRRYGIPFGWTRLGVRFDENKISVTGLSHPHP